MYALRRRSVECSVIPMSVLTIALDEAVVEVGRTDMPLYFPLFAVAQRATFFGKVIDAAGQQM